MARQALRKLVPGRIAFRPVERDGERGYELRWSLVTKALLDGNIGVASPQGFVAEVNVVKVPWEVRPASARGVLVANRNFDSA